VSFYITATNFWPIIRVFEGITQSDLKFVAWESGDNTNRFEAVAGRQYQIRVAGNAPAPSPRPEGVFTFYMSYAPAPMNDAFANRIPLTGKENIFQVSTIGATREPGEPVNGQACAAHSVWYSWRCPGNGVVNLSAELGYYPYISVYTGVSLNSLSLLASNANLSGISCCISFQGVSNTVYQIAVDACGNDTETTTMNVSLQDFPRLEMLRRTPAGVMQMTSRGYYYGQYVLEASTNLVDWIPILTTDTFAVPDGLLLQDPAATNFSRRFYRAVLRSW
jgi:hypothetical protein